MYYRSIESLHSGVAHGPIQRVIDPSGIGERLKTFIFLYHMRTDNASGFGFGFHPHSGIATLTYPLTGDVDYEDTTVQKGW
jgi:redox-sensitive bicupin YhaK (pirin superfamily)